jgi:sugar/nucleoside kinase (ribokinase family)
MSLSALCVGHASWDLCFVVDGYPAENSKAQTDLLVESSGGPAANAAWLLARWGVPTALAAAVGDDEYGRRVRSDLSQGGVDCRLLKLQPGGLTPVSAILSNRLNGSRTITNRKSNFTSLAMNPDALGSLSPCLLLFDGHEPEASLAAMQTFPRAITVLDAGSLRDGTRALAPRVDYLVCSERFAQQVTGVPDVNAHWQDCARRLREMNGRIAVITLGQHGLAFDDGKEQGRLPALRVNAVDTTGAGDIFHGAFAFALLQGMTLKHALRLATVAAGLSVQKFGAQPSVPELEAVTKAIAHE